jgi:hypothetical protein
MNSIGNIQKDRYFRSFRSKAENRHICLYICVGKLCPVLCFMFIEAMKRGDEALNASSLKFLSRVKHFIAYRYKFF